MEMTMKTPWSTEEWRRALVYGLGLSGRAAARLLLRKGVEVTGVARRTSEELDLASLDDGSLARAEGLDLKLGQELEELPSNIDAVVVSPGVPSDRPLLEAARSAGLPVISEVELAFPFLQGPVVGITGTNGKSTTTELTGAMLAASGHQVEVCGNIGKPVSDRVEGAAGRLFVVELSSYQLENLATLRPQAAALLNIAPDHLDRYSSFEAYAAAKGNLFTRQQADDLAVLNADDSMVRRMAGGMRARRRFFSRQAGSNSRTFEDGCRLEDQQVIEVAPGTGPHQLFSVADVLLAGSHNLENAMAAALLARHFGAEPEHLVQGLQGFSGLPHRMERVAEIGGVTFFDDSKGTNVAATAKSLEGLDDGSVHLILGGLHKGDDPGVLRDLVGQKVRRLYLIGEGASIFASALADVAEVENAEVLSVAVERAVEHARSGEVVLLSPACASFDQFKDFAQRGRSFQELVHQYQATPEASHG